MTAEARSTIWGAFMGFFVDMYDVYLPIVALTPALIYFQPKGLPAAAATTVFYVVFAVTLIGRPIGSFIFGHFGDKIGRRKTTMIAVSGFGLVTLLIALLPGYQAIGMAALVLLVLLRLVDGVFLGGEYTAASPLAMEYCPKPKRGFYSAVIQAGYPIAYVAISLLVALMLFVAPAKGGLNSPYVQWGWRIPFIVGSLIAFAFVLWFRRVPESRSWMQSEKTENPIKTLFTGESRKALLQVFIVMTGFWLALNTTISTLPQVLTRTGGLSSTRVTLLLLVANVVLVSGYLLVGVVGQRIGRRPTMMLLGLLITVVSTSAYVVLVQTAGHAGLIEVGLLATLITVLTVSGWGLLSAYINERFHIGVRASGFGIGYSLAVILPAFYSFVMLWMASFMPYKYTQIPLLALGGLLILLGAAMGPETRDVDIAEPAQSPADRPEVSSEAAGRSGDRRGMVPS
ncbi:MAG: MFS transporter [Candidatus Nephthysia bennettiae]|uniref:MFS transporter n=1 Tax=Candidatus Nephthysia bennettiae TaxID=3127016 RepID=A0A934K788_9BACT|nr:MFS transporter [Candidatus Dormibacteraeota bacterium]MBJ7614201.1 MFS transporter [Candidatus Dormibacteraeota bacterium]PZR99081.1 MAG: MFS transporter [Candidatus Dormibacteraeota bacterium]